MESDIKLTKLASCAGCGAKVGAGTLSTLLKDFKTHKDENLIVGFDTSDDACVYKINGTTALVETTDFFPPIVDDPYLFGQIAAANAISDIYAMGASPKIALNLLCISDTMDSDTVKNILRGGYDKVYEAGAIIAGGHTIHGSEPTYGLCVTGFVHPENVLTNKNSKPGDVLILTKPLGVGIITTAAKADLAETTLLNKIYSQMAFLNKIAGEIMVRHNVHSATDITGFSLMGHACEMAEGSGTTLHIQVGSVPFHKEALEFADMGFVPAGAYNNRSFVGNRVEKRIPISRAMEDILYDPQTSGGLLISVSEKDSEKCLKELKDSLPSVEIIGYVTGSDCGKIVLE